MRGRRGRIAPERTIKWGEKGIKGIKYTGEMPRDFQGKYTGQFYIYNERRPLLGVDVRDLPGLAEDAGKKNLEVRQDDGQFVPVSDLNGPTKVKAAPKSKSKDVPKPAKKKDEVDNGS